MTLGTDALRLLDTIILNEEKSAALYRHIVKRLDRSADQAFFEELAADEDRHAKIYEAIRNKFRGTLLEDVEEGDEGYVHLLIRTNLFSRSQIGEEEMDSLLAKMDRYDLAEKMERDAIFYVLELQDLYPSIASEEIRLILKEERKHLQKVFAKKIDQQR